MSIRLQYHFAHIICLLSSLCEKVHIPFAATMLDRRTSIGFPCDYNEYEHANSTPTEAKRTLSLKALFDPEANGGAVCNDAEVEAIVSSRILH